MDLLRWKIIYIIIIIYIIFYKLPLKSPQKCMSIEPICNETFETFETKLMLTPVYTNLKNHPQWLKVINDNNLFCFKEKIEMCKSVGSSSVWKVYLYRSILSV